MINNFSVDIQEQISDSVLMKLVEAPFFNEVALKSNIHAGDVIRLGYKVQEGKKERLQFYEGLVIAIQNRSLGKTFTLRRSVQGIGVEQIFLLNSPQISTISKKQSSKVRRAKLFFTRFLSAKALRLKIKRK